MTIEELTQKIDDLSHEVNHLGGICTKEYFGQHGDHLRSVLRLAGESLKNMSFSMSEFVSVLGGLTTE